MISAADKQATHSLKVTYITGDRPFYIKLLLSHGEIHLARISNLHNYLFPINVLDIACRPNDLDMISAADK